jgi:hypothetical protein
LKPAYYIDCDMIARQSYVDLFAVRCRAVAEIVRVEDLLLEQATSGLLHDLLQMVTLSPRETAAEQDSPCWQLGHPAAFANALSSLHFFKSNVEAVVAYHYDDASFTSQMHSHVAEVLCGASALSTPEMVTAP